MKYRRPVKPTKGKHTKERNLAECLAQGARLATATTCGYVFCPRHEPDNYATHMARHATDSIVAFIR